MVQRQHTNSLASYLCLTANLALNLLNPIMNEFLYIYVKSWAISWSSRRRSTFKNDANQWKHLCFNSVASATLVGASYLVVHMVYWCIKSIWPTMYWLYRSCLNNINGSTTLIHITFCLFILIKQLGSLISL